MAWDMNEAENWKTVKIVIGIQSKEITPQGIELVINIH